MLLQRDPAMTRHYLVFKLHPSTELTLKIMTSSICTGSSLRPPGRNLEPRDINRLV